LDEKAENCSCIKPGCDCTEDSPENGCECKKDVCDCEEGDPSGNCHCEIDVCYCEEDAQSDRCGCDECNCEKDDPSENCNCKDDVCGCKKDVLSDDCGCRANIQAYPCNCTKDICDCRVVNSQSTPSDHCKAGGCNCLTDVPSDHCDDSKTGLSDTCKGGDCSCKLFIQFTKSCENNSEKMTAEQKASALIGIDISEAAVNARLQEGEKGWETYSGTLDLRPGQFRVFDSTWTGGAREWIIYKRTTGNPPNQWHRITQ